MVALSGARQFVSITQLWLTEWGTLMHIYKVKAFARFQRHERITDASLAKAVRDATRGLVDADLGGGLIKQRVARRGQGKRGGYRTVIAFRHAQRAVFLLGFAKSEQASIGDDELEELQRLAARCLALSDEQIERLLIEEDWMEIRYEEE
jgi:hypothetical protein